MSGNPPYIPVELMAELLGYVQHINGDESDEIQLILIACRSNEPPTMMSTIIPSQIPEILQWMIEHHPSARVSWEEPGTRKDN